VQHGGVTLLIHFPNTPQRVNRFGDSYVTHVIPVHDLDHHQSDYAQGDVGQRDLSVVVVDARGGTGRELQFSPDHPQPTTTVQHCTAPRLKSLELGLRGFQSRLFRPLDGRLRETKIR